MKPTAADVAAPDPATDAILGTGRVADEDGTTAAATQPSERSVRDGYCTMAVTDLTADLLQGATAYDAPDANMGEVSAWWPGMVRLRAAWGGGI